MRQIAELINWKQTLFSLPWLLSAVAVSPRLGDFPPPTALRWSLLLCAFLSARVAAMSFNQWLDAEIDRRNPRTAGRPIPAGRIDRRAAQLLAIGSLVAFQLASFAIDATCGVISLMLSPILVAYSLAKRWTWATHLILGFIQGMLPVAVGIALTGGVTHIHLLLGIALGAHIAAMDILYSLQDLPIDLREGLFSIPAAFGEPFAKRWALALHAIALWALFDLGLALEFASGYFPGIWALALSGSAAYWWLFRHRRIDQIFPAASASPGWVVLALILSELT